jgi:alkanesulfonate monooxygenase SsuD/methylene tetrahydromethanopterin reductase-like flavin-dependent oxidoreductase (luciferase family)
LSGRRVIVGAGVGWMKEEFEPCAPSRSRSAQSHRRIHRGVQRLWTSDNPSFSGNIATFPTSSFSPSPCRSRRSDLDRRPQQQAIRRAARLGDGWHPIGGVPTIPLEPEDVAADLSMLREYAEKAGRDPKKIRVALKGSLFDREKQISPGKRRRFIGSAEEVASDIRDYRTVGVDTMIFDVRRPSIAETLERMEWMAKDVFPKV